MKRIPDPIPAAIVLVFIASLLYWIYLSLATRMDIVFDSVGYEDLGRLLYTKGWVEYFTTGPNREPLYPLLIAGVQAWEHVTGLAYTRIMAFFGVAIMLLTQVLIYKILRLFQVRTWICAAVLGYFAVSPALNNAAFSLYSEIAAFPIITGIVLATAMGWEAIGKNDRPRALMAGMLLGLLLAAATLVKAVFECIAPVYLVLLFVLAHKAKKGPLLACLLASVAFYYLPIIGYKSLNEYYNGNFAVTNRASWALYGNTARRMEPLTLQRFAEALAFAPGAGVCNGIFGEAECDFWSYKKSDEFGYGKLGELNSMHFSSREVDSTLLKLSAQKALHNPFQYAFLTMVEGSKMLFWESTKIGFVRYPPWLQKIYDFKLFDNALRLLVFLATAIGVLGLWWKSRKPLKSPLGSMMGTLIFLYIFFFAFFFILTRYALPIAPLYLISIGVCLNKKL